MLRTLPSRDRVFLVVLQTYHIMCIINNLLISMLRAVRENINPQSCCIDLAIDRSIQRNLGFIS